MVESPAAPAGLAEVIADAWLELVEYDDRTSPVEYPKMALITREELARFMAIGHRCTDVREKGDGTVAWPAALTPALRELLGFMCFELGPMAHAYRAAGQYVGADGLELKTRAEDEQAFMLHRFLCHWVTAGDNWRASMREELGPVIEIAKAKAKTNG